MNRRNSKKYFVTKAKTSRLMNSPIIYMQKLLNKDYEKMYNDKKNVYAI